MKKRTLGRLGAVSIILCLVTCCLLGGTLAKYTTTVSGTGTATVAKWAIKAGSTDGGTTITAFTLGQATSGVADGKIAPGTSGTLPVYIDLTGTEVATEVKVYFFFVFHIYYFSYLYAKKQLFIGKCHFFRAISQI